MEDQESSCGKGNRSSATNEDINLESVTIPASPNAVVDGLIENRRVKFYIDSGAQLSVIKGQLVYELGCRFEKLCMDGIAINGTPVRITGKVTLRMQLDKVVLWQTFIIADDLAHDCVLGRDFINKYQADICLWKGEIRLNNVDEGRTVPLFSLHKFKIPAHTEKIIEGYMKKPLQTSTNDSMILVENDFEFLHHLCHLLLLFVIQFTFIVLRYLKSGWARLFLRIHFFHSIT